jgi:holin-like protein
LQFSLWSGGDLFLQKGYLLFLPLVVSLLVALVTTGGIVQLLTTPSSKDEVN